MDSTDSKTKSDERSTNSPEKSLRWDVHFNEKPCVEAAPVWLFEHCPLARYFSKYLKIGMIVETINVYHQGSGELYWLAEIQDIRGYILGLKYIPQSMGCPLIWINCGVPVVKAVGYSSWTNKVAKPPVIDFDEDLENNMIDETENKNSIKKCLPSLIQQESENGCHFEIGGLVEVINMSENGHAQIGLVVDKRHDRLRLQFSESTSESIWVSANSGLVQDKGWSSLVGHVIDASVEYIEKSKKLLLHKVSKEGAAVVDFLLGIRVDQWICCPSVRVQMKLIVLHPFRPSQFHIATVKKMLNYGYFILSIDQEEGSKKGPTEFCYHVTSAEIFPINFCSENNLELCGPRKFMRNGTLNLEHYLRTTNATVATSSMLGKPDCVNRFECGMKLEAVDLRPCACNCFFCRKMG